MSERVLARGPSRDTSAIAVGGKADASCLGELEDGAVWFLSIYPTPVDLQSPGAEGHGLVYAGPASTVGPEDQSLRPRLGGGGKKNGEPLVSSPGTCVPNRSV